MSKSTSVKAGTLYLDLATKELYFDDPSGTQKTHQKVIDAATLLYSTGTPLQTTDAVHGILKTRDNKTFAPAAGTVFDISDGSVLSISRSATALSNPTYLAGWDGNTLKAVKRSDLSVHYATSAGKISDITENDRASSSDVQRRVWFSYNNNTTGRPAYSDEFTYQSSTGTLTAKIFKGALSGTADRSKYLETWKTTTSQGTYGSDYPLYAWWESGTVCKLVVDGYSTKVDTANTANALTVNGGSSGQPVYFTNGVPTALDWHIGNKDVGEHNCDNVTYNFSGYYTSNGPTTTLGASTNDGSLWAQAYNSTWVTQIAQDYRNGNLFVRSKNNGTWQGWKAVLTSTHKPMVFNWSGQSGQPSWLWGGNDGVNMYVYNPSNFSVNYANSAGDANTLDGIDSTGFLRYYNASSSITSTEVVNTPSYVHTVSTSGGSVTTTVKPTGMDNAWGIIHLHTHTGNYATQLGFGGTTGNMYFRNAYNTTTFGDWKTLLDSSNYSDIIDGRYVNAAGDTMSGTLNMNNNAITGVNNLAFADPGANEGISWTGGNGWNIYESPDDLTNNSGNLQFVQNATRRMTLRTDGLVDVPEGVMTPYVYMKPYSVSDNKTKNWYRIWTGVHSNAGGHSYCVFTLSRSYNSPQNESYTFAVTVGYNGDINVTQLSGVKGNPLIPKIRIVYKNSGKVYIDYYANANANYSNTYYVSGFGYGKFQTPTITSETVEEGYTAYEFSTMDGMKTSGRLSIGGSTSDYALTAPSFLCDSWVRTKGATGWYNETYGGGWYMADTTYLRSYNNKMVYSGGRFLSETQPSSWLAGQNTNSGAYNVNDYSNDGSYNPWMRAKNTHTSVKKYFSFGTLGKQFYWIGSTTDRTENGYDKGMSFNVESGLLFAPIVGGDRIYTGYDSGETGSVSCSNWFRSNGGTGWYNASYGNHIYPNTTTSYGGFMMHGNVRGGYEGIVLGNSTAYLNVMSNDTHQGLYNESKSRWIIYYNRANDRISLGGAQTGATDYEVTLYGATYINGRLVVKGNGTKWNEGIRVLPAANGWSNLFFSANDTTEDRHAGGWLIGRRGAAGGITGAAGDFTIEENSSDGANLTIYKNSGGAHLRGPFSTSGAITAGGLITATSSSSHAGVKIGDVYINAIGGQLILQNLSALRFGADNWDCNVWAGLKYDSANKYIYLGLADNSIFTANAAQSGGRIFTPGISYFHVGNQSSYYMTDGGAIHGTVITFPAAAASLNASSPMSITYGKIAAYGTLTINANTDNSGTEYVLLTAGKGLSNTLTDGLAIGSSTLQWQGSNVCTSTEKIIDASGQGATTYYPVVISLPSKGLRRIKLAVQLDSGTKPTWTTHDNGFTSNIDVMMLANGWGTTTNRYMILQDDYGFANYKPAYFVGQITESSLAVFYVRGGGKYRFICDWQAASITLVTAKTTYNNGKFVEPTTGTPAWISGSKTMVTTNIAGSATTLRDKTNGTETYLDYGADGITNPSWYAAWSGYNLRAISPLEVRKGISALGAISDGSYYGMVSPSGADNVWIRTTTQGIIPYQSGSAGSGHQSLGTSSWYFSTAYVDTIHSGTIYTTSWFRSYNNTGWYNETHGGGIYMVDSTYVRTYNDKAFYVSNSGNWAIYAAGGFATARTNGALFSAYCNNTWYHDTLYNHGNGNLSIDAPGGSVYVAYYRGNVYFGGGTYSIDRSGYFNGTSATAKSLYTTAVGASSDTTHATALQNYFNTYKSSTPRNKLISFYSSAMSNGSQYMGYFLNGYDSTPYGGFFVAHYNTPYYVGISNGTFTQYQLSTVGHTHSYLPLAGGTMTGNITLGTYGMLGFGNTIPATHKEVTSFTPEANAVWLATTGGGSESAGICLDGNSIRFWTPNDSVIEFLDSDTAAGTTYASVKFGTVTGGTWQGSTIAVGYGGTGITSNPSMLVNLGSTSAASVFAASPRPGITGTLGVANGGTGVTSWTANRVLYASAATTLSCTSHYVSSTKMAINSTTEPSYTFYVSGTSYFSGAVTVTGTLVLTKTQDASATANNNPALIVGGAGSAAHIEIDNNEIIAKSNGTTQTTLYIQDTNGVTVFGGQVKAPSFNATSDMRLKTNFRTFKHGDIFSLPVYKFDFIIGEKNKIGCMAQDLQQICPEIVHQGDDGYLTIEESKIVYLLLDKMKEMQKEINALKEGK